MSTFIDFRNAVHSQIQEMSKTGLFTVSVDKDVMIDLYLDSYPEGTNEIFRERRKHDCNCCRQFIRKVGNVVTIKDNKLVSIWDVEVGAEYGVVAKVMSEFIKQHTVDNQFLSDTKKVGTTRNIELGTDIVWDHLYTVLDSKYVSKDIASTLGVSRETFNVFRRSMEELSVGSAEIVLDLIADNNLRRGEENKSRVKSFLDHKKTYDTLEDSDKHNWLWMQVMEHGEVLRYRNTVIGTLLTDISDGVELDVAVVKFEKKVDPTNFNRTKAIVTPRMIKSATKVITDKGIEPAIYRRCANTRDIPVHNLLFTATTDKPTPNGLLEEVLLDAEKKQAPKSSKNVVEMGIEDFIKNVLPTTKRMELLLKNEMVGSLMTLTAPQYINPNIFKWANGLGWSYNGEVTDAITERVKNAGGIIDAKLRFSLAWDYSCDLDLYVVSPTREIISYRNKKSKCGGNLDIDANANLISQNPVENIFWMDNPPVGDYIVGVDNFQKRQTKLKGFELLVTSDGGKYNLSSDKPVNKMRSYDSNVVATFHWDGQQLTLKDCKIDNTAASQKVWGLDTETYVPVSMMMLSPNHWEESIGNKHYFFILEGGKTQDSVRGLYNEFIKAEYRDIRKTLELLGSKTKAEPTEDQLSGVGFSSTSKKSVVLRVEGSYTRTIKVNI